MAESVDESINCNAVGDVTFTVTLFDVGLSAANWPTGLNVAVIVSDPNASVEVVSVACAWPLTFVNGTGACGFPSMVNVAVPALLPICAGNEAVKETKWPEFWDVAEAVKVRRRISAMSRLESSVNQRLPPGPAVITSGSDRQQAVDTR